MIYTIFDIEADNLLEDVTKIHCLSYRQYKSGKLIDKNTLTEYTKIKNFLESQEILVGHNIIQYDLPVLKKLLGLNYSNIQLIDTLALSWYLYNKETKHGLEEWGDKLGVAKPIIEDWENLNIEDYIHRCETDVEINSLLFLKQFKYLFKLYDNNLEQINNLIGYLSFKLDCIREQEEIGILIDIPHVQKCLEELKVQQEVKLTRISAAMPLQHKYKYVQKPKSIYKKDGTISKKGEIWLELLQERNLPETWEEPLEVLVSSELGNPKSTSQLKDWLYSLGWEPIKYNDVKNKEGIINNVPQIYDGSKVCSSITKLYEIEPVLEELDQLTLINHRIGVFQAFIDNQRNSKIKSTIGGFTNTNRVKHRKPLANLAGYYSFYGKEIRATIIAPEGFLSCGSDMSALEDTTKQHYMYYFDPKYVTEMRTPGFDPHLDVAVLAGLLTPEQAQEHKDGTKSYKVERSLAKTVNFAGIYGAGPPKIASSTGMSLDQAKALHKTYWERNKAVKQVVENLTIKVFFKNGTIKVFKEKILEKLLKSKEINEDTIEQMWLLQPVSKFWYSLRFLKDCFSTCNQGTAVYVFDLWVKELRSRGIRINFQYHDEVYFIIKDSSEESEKYNKIVQDSIDAVNEKVKLNVPLACSLDFGKNYAEVH